MALSGQKPIPTKLKMLRGNPGKRPLPEHEPRPASEMPSPPSVLGDIALEEWYRIGPELQRIGVLTMADRSCLASYCKVYERWCMADSHLKSSEDLVNMTGTGTLAQNPYVSIANKAMELMHKFGVELGLTPSSRTRMTGRKDEEIDELESFLAHTPRKSSGRTRKAKQE